MGTWQEEKDEIERKKIVIFAEYGEEDWKDPVGQINFPWDDYLKRQLNPRSFGQALFQNATWEGSPASKFFGWEDTYEDEKLFITDPDKFTEYQDRMNLISTGPQESEKREYRLLADEMKADPDLNMEWFTQGDPDFPGGNMGYAPGFVPQAEWWKTASGPSTDVEIVGFRGEEMLEEKLKVLAESGFLTGEEDIDAILMGHRASDARYGGVQPDVFGKLLDEYQLDTKFDDVFLASCAMGTNELACMNISKAFDGARVHGQGDPNAPWKSWSRHPEWGTDAIDKTKIADPNALMSERIFVENAPFQTFEYLTDEEKEMLNLINKAKQANKYVNLDENYP